MQQFIPFEDDWDALKNLRPEDLIPYRVGLLALRDPAAQSTHRASPPVFAPSPCYSPTACIVSTGRSGA
jgi:hypothetical protein